MKPKTYLCHDGCPRTAAVLVDALHNVMEERHELIHKNNVLNARIEMVYFMSELLRERQRAYAPVATPKHMTGCSAL